MPRRTRETQNLGPQHKRKKERKTRYMFNISVLYNVHYISNLLVKYCVHRYVKLHVAAYPAAHEWQVGMHGVRGWVTLHRLQCSPHT